MLKSYAIGTIVLSTALFGLNYLSNAKDPSSQTVKVLYQPNGTEASITGRVSLNGDPPTPKPIDTSADPICTQTNPRLMTEDVVANSGNLANVFVYVESGEALDRYSFSQPTSLAMLERKGCRYEPRVLGLRTGQELAIRNSDLTLHNTHPQPKTNREWNQTQPAGVTMTWKFEEPETLIPFKCNQHPWEKAFVGVFSHPFFAVTDEQGGYRIEGLPPGNYKLVVWHERFGTKTLELNISARETRIADFSFDAADNQD